MGGRGSFLLLYALAFGALVLAPVAGCHRIGAGEAPAVPAPEPPQLSAPIEVDGAPVRLEVESAERAEGMDVHGLVDVWVRTPSGAPGQFDEVLSRNLLLRVPGTAATYDVHDFSVERGGAVHRFAFNTGEGRPADKGPAEVELLYREKGSARSLGRLRTRAADWSIAPPR